VYDGGKVNGVDLTPVLWAARR